MSALDFLHSLGLLLMIGGGVGLLLCLLAGLASLSPSRRTSRRREVIYTRPAPITKRVQTTTQHWWA